MYYYHGSCEEMTDFSFLIFTWLQKNIILWDHFLSLAVTPKVENSQI